MRESDVIERLRRIATAPEARGLRDDVAVLDDLVITHDTIAEGVHFLPTDPAASVGWKLVAVNLSDLAGKGATPAGALLSLTIVGSGQWEEDFLGGIEAACESYGLPLLGGDTIGFPDGAPRVLGLTAIGRAGRESSGPRRRQTRRCFVAGRNASAMPRQASPSCRQTAAIGPLVDIYRRPIPQLVAGQALAPHANAMMDVSDGLLIDAQRMAEASGAPCASSWTRCRFGSVRRRARARSPRPAVRGNRRRRLCAARRAARRTRPVNTFFTRADEDQPHRPSGRGRGFAVAHHDGERRRAAGKAWL